MGGPTGPDKTSERLLAFRVLWILESEEKRNCINMNKGKIKLLVNLFLSLIFYFV